MRRSSPTPRLWLSSILCTSLVGSLAVGCKGESEKKESAAQSATPAPAAKGPAAPAQPRVSPAAVLDRVKPLISPLPAVAESADNPITEEKVALGRALYYETRLSENHSMSCNTCHELDNFGVDTREQEGARSSTSLGHKNQPGARNSPTVYNAAFHTAQFWDGRAPDVEAQAQMPILNPVEMGMPDADHVLKTLRSIPGYQELFAAAFPGEKEPITMANLGKAIGAFERKLVTPSRFDEFLRGKMTALTPAELQGLQTFLDVGCVTCHNGATLGGLQFQKLGSVKPWPTEIEDRGRAEITNSAADEFVFKVPSLRNITKTEPYLHDGSIESLEEIVRLMGEHQSAAGKLEDAQVKAIVTFLGALEGEVPTEYIAKPELPESGPDTPPPAGT